MNSFLFATGMTESLRLAQNAARRSIQIDEWIVTTGFSRSPD
jgi:hypothetical protein